MAHKIPMPDESKMQSVQLHLEIGLPATLDLVKWLVRKGFSVELSTPAAYQRDITACRPRRERP